MAYCSKCGSPLAENSNFCPQCGGSNEQQPQQDNFEESEKGKIFNVSKKALRIIIPLLILAVLGFTCPDKKQHIDAIHTELMDYIKKQEGNETAMFASLGAGLIDKVLAAKLDVNNYVLFSTGSLEDSGSSKIVSFGILGHVFTFGLDKDVLGNMDKKGKTTAL
ncbi:DUF4359 domain-containing protein [Prevotella aurantiaca]